VSPNLGRASGDRGETERVRLQDATIERVRQYWQDWAAQPVLNAVSVVTIGQERFLSAPEFLRIRLEEDIPTDLDRLVRTIGGEVDEVIGEARLAYADAVTLRLPATDGVIEIGADDERLAALAAGSDRSEWSEASAERSDARFGVVEENALVAVAGVQVWTKAIGQLRVFTAPVARGHGLAPKVASAAIDVAIRRGLVPQWRSRRRNEISTRVAEKLGFVSVGTQTFVRVKAAT
jgi:GNAT superfamily N-acetyltransferase